MTDAMTGSAVRKAVFLTGTRADFGKQRSLMDAVSPNFEVEVFVTGMHMLSRYGSTWTEVVKRGYTTHKFINQNYSDTMDAVLGKTIAGFSDYVKESRPDLIVVHGDRVEALAGAVVGALNNILVAHIEGGELSGTIDDSLRHATSKLAHAHFVTNETAKQRLIQLGEHDIFTIGSPNVDAILGDLPSMEAVRARYDLDDGEYAVLLFHPVTTELDSLEDQVKSLVNAVIESGDRFVVIYPNNDTGSDIILDEYKRLEGHKILPSMRFEHFLRLIQGAKYMLGNSSSALMEAPYYGTPAVNVGTRQQNRCNLPSVVDCHFLGIREAIRQAKRLRVEPVYHFGCGNSGQQFLDILLTPQFWSIGKQKAFRAIDSAA